MATKKKTPKKSSLEDRFQDLLDMDTPTIITLYGRPGTGKTTISCTLPKPLLLIDVKDKGTDSGKREDLEPGDITVFELESFDEIYDIYDYLEENPDKFKSVVIDHMTALQDFCYEKVMDEEGKSKMSQGMYGTAGGYLKEVINLYKGLTDVGITPDVEVDLSYADYEALYYGALDWEEDEQLQSALEILREKIA